MEFKEAVKVMEEGKHCRTNVYEYRILNGVLQGKVDGVWQDARKNPLYYLKLNWELMEEREDLCYKTKEWVDKQNIFTEEMQEELFEIIRTKNKEFIKWLNTTPDHIPDYIGQRDKKAKEIFGEELI